MITTQKWLLSVQISNQFAQKCAKKLSKIFAKLCTFSYLLLLYQMIVLRYFYLPSYPPVTIILLKYVQEISYFETEKDRKCKIADDLYFK